MGRNVEIKARLGDGEEVLRRLRRLGASDEGVLEQTDTFFGCGSGRLKLRECRGRPAELIRYDREDRLGTKTSRYEIHAVPDPDLLKGFLERAQGILGVVRKRRRLFMVGQTRVHLDRVDSLGEYLELEVVLRAGQAESEGHGIARRLQTDLGIAEEDLVDCAYFDLLRRRESPRDDRI